METIAAEEPRCDSEGFTEGKYCRDCSTYISGHEIVEAMGHTYTDVCDTECDVCSAEREAEHRFNEDGVCELCNTTKTENDIEDAGSENVAESDENTNKDGNKKDGFKWWIVIVIGGVVIAAGVAVTVFIVLKKKKD